ncbi:hypothetical protein [Kibdelosporangium aridum]|uniref:hypothetical protein n=1 Tax=Kibdelosporangium aridum TaxID=2030 RepID=UPI001F326E7B|nr:hypothetical protein [Kibdelosporangium aridum]
MAQTRPECCGHAAEPAADPLVTAVRAFSFGTPPRIQHWGGGAALLEGNEE